NTGVLQRVGLSPGECRADHLTACGAVSLVRLPGSDQGLQQGRLAGTGDAGEHGDGATFAEGVDRRTLFRREVDARRLDGASQRCNRQGPGAIADVLLGELGELLLDADLRRVTEADPILEQADDESDLLTGDADAAALQQLDHPPD